MKNQHWHHIRFELINREPELDTCFSLPTTIVSEDSVLHYMIANEIFGPIVEKYGNIQTWRFHRIRDENQHDFKFKAYCNSDLIRKQIFPQIERHELVAKLYDLDFLIHLSVARCDSYDMKDDHDLAWPMAIKEVWPYIINGVSIAWLKMIQSTYKKILVAKKIKKVEKLDFWEKVSVYNNVKQEIGLWWREWAGHSVFHHANAVFGYKYIRSWYGPKSVTISEPRSFLTRILGRYKITRNSKKIKMSVRF